MAHEENDLSITQPEFEIMVTKFYLIKKPSKGGQGPSRTVVTWSKLIVIIVFYIDIISLIKRTEFHF